MLLWHTGRSEPSLPSAASSVSQAEGLEMGLVMECTMWGRGGSQSSGVLGWTGTVMAEVRLPAARLLLIVVNVHSGSALLHRERLELGWT
jgi:cytochrome b